MLRHFEKQRLRNLVPSASDQNKLVLQDVEVSVDSDSDDEKDDNHESVAGDAALGPIGEAGDASDDELLRQEVLGNLIDIE